tara:strand:+ start:217 stop:417 length:201 start_codon:yes stop_codon:yes gene_type:complete
MKKPLILLLLIPMLCVTQETTVENMLNAFDNIDEFKINLFKKGLLHQAIRSSKNISTLSLEMLCKN